MSEKLAEELSTLRIDRGRERAPSPRIPPIVWKAALAAVVLLAAALLWLGLRAPPVEVARVTAVEIKEAPTVLVAGGYVVAHHKIELGSKVLGRVAWIGVEKGDTVRKGQLLVRLDDSEYTAQVNQARGTLQAAQARLQQLETGSRPEEIQQARARLEETQANLQKAKLALDRAQDLTRQGVVAQETLDNARAVYDMSKAQADQAQKNYELVRLGTRREEVDQARALVEQSRGALGFAQAQLDATQIRSPIDGTVLERLVESGEMVTTMFVGERGAKSSVVSLADLNDLQVELDISQTDFARVSMGQSCSVTPDAFQDRRYRGVVAELAPEANRQKATVQVKVHVKEPDRYLRPEMNARVSFEDSRAGQVTTRELRVPRSAVFQSGSGSAVLAVENSRAVLKNVTTGAESGGVIRILSGLTGDETVITSNPSGLQNGQRVRTK